MWLSTVEEKDSMYGHLHSADPFRDRTGKPRRHEQLVRPADAMRNSVKNGVQPFLVDKHRCFCMKERKEGGRKP